MLSNGSAMARQQYTGHCLERRGPVPGFARTLHIKNGFGLIIQAVFGYMEILVSSAFAELMHTEL